MSRKIIIYGGYDGSGAATGRALRDQGCDLHLVGRNEACFPSAMVRHFLATD